MMMLKYLGEVEAANTILEALKDTLVEGRVRTLHMGGDASTTEFAQAVAEKVRAKG